MQKIIQSAFTLIELVMVILVLGILTAILVNSWPSQAPTVSTASTLVLQHLRYIRTYSMTHQTPYKIEFNHFNPLSYTMKALGEEGAALSIPAALGGSETQLEGVSLSLQGFNQMIIFNGQGMPCLDEQLSPLTTPVELVLSDGKNEVRIQIQPLTGFAFKE